MIALDTSFLVDYLDGEARAMAFLDDHVDDPLFTPAISLFEVYRGAAGTTGGSSVGDVAAALDWVEPLPIDDAAAREAAVVEVELLDAGRRVNLGDVLIAGVCRRHGARIVARDDHFDRIDGVERLVY